MSRWAIALAFVLLCVGACAHRRGPPPPSSPSKLAEASVPDFARPTLTGARLDTKTLRGKVVVIKFFARYCRPCKVTLPEAERLARTHEGDVVVVGVSEDEFPSEAEALVNDYGLSFPVVHDAGHVLAGRFRVTEIPITFVVDGGGVVRWIGGPGMQPGDLEKAIAAVR